MRLKEYLNEKGNRQKFAFQAVKEVLTDLHPQSIDVIKKDEKLRVKMPDTPASPTHRQSIGLEFYVNVDSTN